ncbi:hypothetical protein DL93DRAFT_1633659 [Clavulina sp. PMI_390]|nr:hypothetical protein DL93DRAFT_1633659 [Clavulina sp. PMI_390]
MLPETAVYKAFNLNIVLAHVKLYGSGLILHSLWATKYPESRSKMLECLQGLVDICTHIRKHQHPHLGLVNITHMMNAIRVITRELKRPEVRENTSLANSHYRSIESLLDFLDDTMTLLPAWADVLLTLKVPLIAAADSLSD